MIDKWLLDWKDQIIDPTRLAIAAFILALCLPGAMLLFFGMGVEVYWLIPQNWLWSALYGIVLMKYTKARWKQREGLRGFLLLLNGGLILFYWLLAFVVQGIPGLAWYVVKTVIPFLPRVWLWKLILQILPFYPSL